MNGCPCARDFLIVVFCASTFLYGFTILLIASNRNVLEDIRGMYQEIRDFLHHPRNIQY